MTTKNKTAEKFKVEYTFKGVKESMILTKKNSSDDSVRLNLASLARMGAHDMKITTLKDEQGEEINNG